MEYKSSPNAKLIAIAAEALAGKNGTNKFTRRDIIKYINFTLLKDSPKKRNEQSLNPMIQALTVNAPGGAPGGGAYRKKLLWLTGRGQLMLYNTKLHGTSQAVRKATSVAPLEKMKEGLRKAKPVAIPEEKVEETPPPLLESESRVRDFLLQLLYYNLGGKDSWSAEEGTPAFIVDPKYGDLKCISEGSLQYKLPSGYVMSHKSDILIDDRTRGRHISIEIKHRSAVTDQFKCRAYDMLHLKQSHPRLYGIMIYLKGSTGISPDHAKSICYPFDYFISVAEPEIYNPKKWEPLLLKIKEKLEQKA
jgi:hypothetical protein